MTNYKQLIVKIKKIFDALNNYKQKKKLPF